MVGGGGFTFDIRSFRTLTFYIGALTVPVTLTVRVSSSPVMPTRVSRISCCRVRHQTAGSNGDRNELDELIIINQVIKEECCDHTLDVFREKNVA